jgi:hypothetical protein
MPMERREQVTDVGREPTGMCAHQCAPELVEQACYRDHDPAVKRGNAGEQ